jgi:hypothetical protein
VVVVFAFKLGGGKRSTLGRVGAINEPFKNDCSVNYTIQWVILGELCNTQIVGAAID